MNVLAARSKPLVATVVVLAAVCVWMAANSVVMSLADGDALGFVVAAALVALAVGLWRLSQVARILAVFALWVLVVLVILGTVNPFSAMDELGPEPPPVIELLLLHVAPFVLPALVALHVLGKYRAEFTTRDRIDGTSS